MQQYTDKYSAANGDADVAEAINALKSEVDRRKEEIKKEMSERPDVDGGIIGVCKIAVKYKSQLPDGSIGYVSGALFMDRWDHYAHNKQQGFILANHYTIGSEYEAPSESQPHEALLCVRKYIVVMSDYIGFGPTRGNPQTYLHAESTANAVVNLALKARDIMGDYKFTKIGDKIYNVGYSQCGHTTMAVHKLIQEKYSDKLKLTKTIAGGGPYDIPTVYNEFVTTNRTGIPATIPLIVLGINYAEGLHLDMSKVFLEPLLSNYTDWAVSKAFTIDQIDAKMGGEDTPVNKILHADALDLNNAQTKKLMAAFKKNSLNQGWAPTTAVPIVLFHSSDDDVVPVICTRNMAKYIKKKTGSDPGMEIAPYGDHMKAGIIFVARVALEQIPL